jgi:hypothetical protein
MVTSLNDFQKVYDNAIDLGVRSEPPVKPEAIAVNHFVADVKATISAYSSGLPSL